MDLFDQGLQGRFERGGQVGGLSPSPVIEEEVARFHHGHVVMNRDDVDATGTETLQDRLRLVFQHGKIAVHHRVVSGSREGGPGVCSHILSDLASAGHFWIAPDDELHHAVLFLWLSSEHSDERSSADRTGRGEVFVAMVRFKIGLMPVIGVCAVLGFTWR